MAIACHSWLIGAFTEVVPVKITEAPDNFHQFYISYKKHGRSSVCSFSVHLDFRYYFVVPMSYKKRGTVANS